MPLQADDIVLYYQINSGLIELLKFSEVLRVPFEGATLFYSYKLLHYLNSGLSVNVILYIFYSFHFFSTLLFYKILITILNLINSDTRQYYAAYLAVILFLITPIAADSYANLSMTGRIIGFFFVLLYVYFKIQIFAKDEIDWWLFKLTGLSILILISIGYYENYLVFILIGYLLVFLAKKKKAAVKFQLFENLVVVSIFVAKLFFVSNNFQTRGINIHLFHVLKHVFLYFVTILIPNLHGLIFLGTPIFLCCVVFVIIFSGEKICIKKEAILIISLIWFSLIFIFTISLTPYYVPRALYPIIPFIMYILSYFTFRIKNLHFRTVIISFLILSFCISMWHFFYMQNDIYKLAENIKNKVMIVSKKEKPENYQIVIDNYSISGARLFFKKNEYFIIKLIEFQNNLDNMEIGLKVNYKSEYVEIKHGILKLIITRIQDTFSNKKTRVRIERL